jgi:hypothetical protein
MELYIFFIPSSFTVPLVLANQASYCILHGIGNDGVSFIFNPMIFVCNSFIHSLPPPTRPLPFYPFSENETACSTTFILQKITLHTHITSDQLLTVVR